VYYKKITPNLGEQSIWDDKSVIQKNLHRLEKWTDRNLVKFNKGKHKAVYLGWNNCVQGYRKCSSPFQRRQMKYLWQTQHLFLKTDEV